MASHNLADGIARLEAISAAFDYDKAQQYVVLAKSFLMGAQQMSQDTPLFDVCDGLDLALPQDIDGRLDAFFDKKPEYAPTVRKVCVWYLRDIHAKDLRLTHEVPSIYEPLIQMLEMGGDFYEHHGALCIRDAAMLRFANVSS